jgi:NifU-like protein involved in Fe-S cluster formation
VVHAYYKIRIANTKTATAKRKCNQDKTLIGVSKPNSKVESMIETWRTMTKAKTTYRKIAKHKKILNINHIEIAGNI